MTQKFQTLADFRALLRDLPAPDSAAIDGAVARNAQLTKPPGALGRIEDLAIWYAGWRGDPRPSVTAPQIIVFAGNHGVAARGVSAFPPEVTAQMVENFRNGGAAVNQLAKVFHARIDVHALSLDTPTGDFTEIRAMDDAALVAALRAGWEAVDPATDLLVVGEMGIGNTTAAAALAAALFGGTGADWTGRGTGVTGPALTAKQAVVDAGLARHAGETDPLARLGCFGGREMAAMAGAVIRARLLRIPVILDGFICCAAVAPLSVAQPGALDHCVAGHLSSECAHDRLLKHLGKAPLLSLGLRLGEGSGAALAIGILQGAVACHSGMATFAEAGVAGG